MLPSRIVIVGAGQAAAAAIDTLRRKGFTGAIALVGEEESWPYQRPPLSKKYLAGAMAAERLLIRPPHFYGEHAIEMHLSRRVTHIDRGAQRVRLDDGTALPYDELLLATGSRPRALSAPGAGLPGVHFLRTLKDVEAIRGEFARAERVVIVGGGYIGLEVAATCRELGLDTTVLEMADRTMNRVTCAPRGQRRVQHAGSSHRGRRLIRARARRDLRGWGGISGGSRYSGRRRRPRR
jgi:3-phenylpropionate/trans-cinnamate dioxygenase ferredoxin reductase subunit